MTNLFQEIKKSVSFVFKLDNAGIPVPIGTGFFVGVKNEVNNKLLNIYFVTAKHVLQDEQGNYFQKIALRLNTQCGDSQLIEIDLSNVKVFTHEDAMVDIAVLICLPDEKIIDFKCIPDDLITTPELIATHEITEGDEVFFTGLFTSYIGQRRNQPILRFGKVSLIPEEKIEWQEMGKPPKLVDLYLLECQSFGGNSGSPVFFHLAPTRKPGIITTGVNIFLAGIMKGSFISSNEVLINKAASNLISLQNIGIAAVTPAYKLHEILFSDETMALRKGS